MNAPHDSQPLADRIRPNTLDQFVGQRHLVGPGKPLALAIQQDRLYSMIFWGPPGVGKTTLARLIAHHTGRRYFEVSAVSAGKAEIRAIVEQVQAQEKRDLFSAGQPQVGRAGAVLFLDEIHRFNKAQQDFLLPYVEDGTLVLIGATTENPSFEVNSALLSRCRVFVLEALQAAEIGQIIDQVQTVLGISLAADARDFLADFANGDARQALNMLETALGLYGDGGTLTLEQVKTAIQSRALRYEKGAEEHYNTISAYIKSMRASNPDAALYYLARMIQAGEDPKFIARRMVIFASEDIGNAQPTALVVANEVFRAVETIGLPECQYTLAQGTVYMALAPKDRSAGDAYFAALEDVEREGNLPIPMQLRNAPTRLMKELGYGQSDGSSDLLPEKLHGRKYYQK